jgi:hypothetical protein
MAFTNLPFCRAPHQPSLEGAMALASLPKAVQPAEELTPQLRMERAKQAERAHLLQICMELGVEIYDVRSFCTPPSRASAGPTRVMV